MPTKAKPQEYQTQEMQAVDLDDADDPKTSPDEPKWHNWNFQENTSGTTYQHEFGQAIGGREATDRILKLHGKKSMPEGARVWHEEVIPVEPPVVIETTSSPEDSL
jgi:hypothetical protein